MSQYRTAMVRDLQPGEWVMNFPRDKQVALIELSPVIDMVSPNAGHMLANRWATIIYMDDSRETLPVWSIVFVALPVLKRPYLMLPHYKHLTRHEEALKEAARAVMSKSGQIGMTRWMTPTGGDDEAEG